MASSEVSFSSEQYSPMPDKNKEDGDAELQPNTAILFSGSKLPKRSSET